MLKKLGNSMILLTTAVIWGFAFVAQVLASQTEGLGAMTFCGIRFLMGSCALLPVILLWERRGYEKRRVLRTVRSALLGGAVLFIASALQQYGTAITASSGKASFLTGIYMVLVPIFSLLFLRTKNHWNIWVAAVLALVGLYLLCMTGERFSFGWGEALLLIGSLFWATHILVVDRFARGAYPLLFSCVQTAVCGLLFCCGMLLFETVTWEAVRSAAYPILYGGLMSVGVAYTLQVVGQRRADNPTSASIILSTESVFGALGGVLFLRENLGWTGYLGCALIFAGIVLSQLEPRVRRKMPQKAA